IAAVIRLAAPTVQNMQRAPMAKADCCMYQVMNSAMNTVRPNRLATYAFESREPSTPARPAEAIRAKTGRLIRVLGTPSADDCQWPKMLLQESTELISQNDPELVPSA